MNYYSDHLVMASGETCRGFMHTIVKGDTLYKLSRFYGVSLESIFDANPDADIYHLAIGQKICIPINQPSAAAKPEAGYVRIQKTEKLSSFLDEHHMSLSQFERLNTQFTPEMLNEGTYVNISAQKNSQEMNRRR